MTNLGMVNCDLERLTGGLGLAGGSGDLFCKGLHSKIFLALGATYSLQCKSHRCL